MKIDVVIPWVDCNDKKWQDDYIAFSGKNQHNFAQYRDWGLLKYWFRCIEKNASWINNVFFITCGHVPSWLNLDCKKLKVIRHSDYMDSKYLPTFSSHPIELNLHKIKELSEHFIYFNDDIFIINKVEPTDFFYKGLPLDNACLSTFTPATRSDVISYVIYNDVATINMNFSKREKMKKYLWKWLSVKNGLQTLMKNIYCAFLKKYSAFENPHIAQAFLKSTFEEVWEKEGEYLDFVSGNKFRTKSDVNQWLMRYWQLINGKFYPHRKIGKMTTLEKGKLGDIQNSFLKNKIKILCLNDNPNLSDDEYLLLKGEIIELFDKNYPYKSIFENA